jgi:hypothetical protein
VQAYRGFESLPLRQTRCSPSRLAAMPRGGPFVSFPSKGAWRALRAVFTGCLPGSCSAGGEFSNVAKTTIENRPTTHDYESRGQEFESLRARHLRYSKGLARVCGFKQDSRSHAASLRSQPKISKTTPCKVAGGRRQRHFGPALDTSGKSMALLHHRTIR